MTPTKKETVRVSSARDAGRNIVVILGPGELIGFRLKGTRKVYTTTVTAIYQRAVIAERRAEQEAKRKGRRR